MYISFYNHFAIVLFQVPTDSTRNYNKHGYPLYRGHHSNFVNCDGTNICIATIAKNLC